MKNSEIIEKIAEKAKRIGRQINLMEVCGTHTQAISRYGIRDLMPKNVNLITGPGCPVCVTAQRDIDAIINLALAGIPVATYGDVLRVPGYFGNLDQAREKGAKVFDVYSVEEALEIQKDYPDLVFFGLGFDTTVPMTAYAIKKSLTVYSAHKIFVPAMEALLQMGEIKIDGFIDPGHVSAIIGTEPYRSMEIPQVITGFTAEDVLTGILMLLDQIEKGKFAIENEYVRVVRDEGNYKARKITFDVFEISDGLWRGFGKIASSGLEIKKKYAKFDAKVKYKDILDKVDFSKSGEPVGCKCGEMIRGLKNPKQCPMFSHICTPDNPVGPCMVSIEGSCNVEYRYGKK